MALEMGTRNGEPGTGENRNMEQRSQHMEQRSQHMEQRSQDMEQRSQDMEQRSQHMEQRSQDTDTGILGHAGIPWNAYQTREAGTGILELRIKIRFHGSWNTKNVSANKKCGSRNKDSGNVTGYLNRTGHL
jgi:hypothetical protein